MRRSSDSVVVNADGFESTGDKGAKSNHQVVVIREKATMRLFFDKPEPDLLNAQAEVISQELNRLYNPTYPQTLLAKGKDGYHVYSSSINKFVSLQDLINKLGPDEVIKNINNGKYKNFGGAVVISLKSNEADLHEKQLGLDEHNRFVRIDGDWCNSRLRFGDKSIYKFNITNHVVDKLPMLDTDNYLAYNWFDQASNGKLELPGDINFINQVNSNIVKHDINVQILKCMLTPATYIKKTMVVNAVDKDQGFLQLDEHIKSKLQLIKSACTTASFRKFIASDEAQVIAKEHIASLQNHVMNNGNTLDPDIDNIAIKVNAELKELQLLAATSRKNGNEWLVAYCKLVTRNVQEIRDGWLCQFVTALDSKDKETLFAVCESHPDVLAYNTKHNENPLLLAAKRNFHEAFAYFVHKGGDYKHLDIDGNNALLIASHSGALKIVKQIIRGANLNIDDINIEGQDALMMAANAGHTDIVKYLLKHGADIRHINDNGRTALTLAAAAGHTDVVREIMADSNIKDELKQVQAALNYAIYYSKFETAVAILSAFDLDELMRDDDCARCIRVFAAATNNDLLFTYAMKINSTKLDFQLENTATALSYLAANGKIEEAIDYAYFDNTFDGIIFAQDNLALVHYAAASSNENALKKLIAIDADLNIKTSAGQTPLQLAVLNQNLDCIDLLLQSGKISPESLNEAFYYALDHKLTDIAKYLLTYNPDVNYTPNIERNYSPLMLAAIIGDAELVYDILNNKDLNSINHAAKNGATAFSKAIEYGNEVAAVLILNHRDYIAGADKDILDRTLINACEDKKTDLAKALLTAKADINFVDVSNNDVTPLIKAARSGATEIVKLLIEHPGFHSLNSVSALNSTAFSVAAECNEPEIARMLGCLPDTNVLNKDNQNHTAFYYLLQDQHYEICADILIKHKLIDYPLNDKTKDTLLHILAHTEKTDEVMKLIRANANVNVVNNYGETPFMIAAAEGNLTCMQALLKNGDNKSLHKPNNDGVTPLLAAVINDEHAAAEFILNKGNIDFSKLENGAAKAFSIALLDNHDYDLCDKFIAAGFNVNNIVDNEFNNRCCHLAAARNDMESINYLLRLPTLDLSIQNSHGKTASTIAKESGDINLHEKLVSKDRERLTGSPAATTSRFFDHPELRKEKNVFIKGPPIPKTDESPASNTTNEKNLQNVDTTHRISKK